MRLCPPVRHTFFPCCLHYHLLNLSQCFPNIAWLSCLGISDVTGCILLLVTFSKRAYHPLQPQFAAKCPTRQPLGNIHLQSWRACLLRDKWMKRLAQFHSDKSRCVLPAVCSVMQFRSSASLFTCRASAENEEGRRMFNRETTLSGINDTLVSCHDLWKIG